VICTSTTRRSSTRISSGFNLHEHSSPSFGSQSGDSNSERARVEHCWVGTGASGLIPRLGTFAFAAARGSLAPSPRRRIALLGPCYKTGVSVPTLKRCRGEFQAADTRDHATIRPEFVRTHRCRIRRHRLREDHSPIWALALLTAGNRIGYSRRSPPKWLPSPRPTATRFFHDGNVAHQG